MSTASTKILITRFRATVVGSENWFLALLKIVREWPIGEENVENVYYRYLIAGEALDLIQLCARLIQSAKDLIPEQEQLDLLFYNHFPMALTAKELKEYLGEAKYNQYLNFFYGITVEDAIQEITAEEVRKEERGVRARHDSWITDEAFVRIYDKTQHELMDSFRAKNNLAAGDISLIEAKEFSYWLFKYRLTHSDPEKSASDTKRALAWLHTLHMLVVRRPHKSYSNIVPTDNPV